MEFIRRDRTAGAGCVLCGYVERAPSRESLVLVQQDEAYVVLNKYPYTAGHLMVVPKLHVSELGALSERAHVALWSLARAAIDALGAATGAPGMNVGLNLGAAAGAGIVEHVHVHLVPRWPGDNNFMPVIGDVRVMHEYLEATWDHLSPHFEKLSAAIG
jgi:ATP adenylyltransferase